MNLTRLTPKWLGDREDLVSVGGDKSKSDNSWRDTKKENF